MHGFAKATVALPMCPEHAHLQWPDDLVNRTSKDLVEELMSACPEDCKMHVGRPASYTKSTIHVGLINDCLMCWYKSYWRSGASVNLVAGEEVFQSSTRE